MWSVSFPESWEHEFDPDCRDFDLRLVDCDDDDVNENGHSAEGNPSSRQECFICDGVSDRGDRVPETSKKKAAIKMSLMANPLQELTPTFQLKLSLSSPPCVTPVPRS